MEWKDRPVIAILNTWSDAQPCHMHFKSRVDDVKRGILQAGGFPMELPALSLSESFLKPTTMLYRNLLAMETEEALRSQPVDGAVMMGGCDKTTPGLLMGAISMNLPAIFLPAGTKIAGMFMLVAPSRRPGVVLSQPPISTTPSTGWERSSSSVSIASMLRYIMVVGLT